MKKLIIIAGVTIIGVAVIKKTAFLAFSAGVVAGRLTCSCKNVETSQ